MKSELSLGDLSSVKPNWRYNFLAASFKASTNIPCMPTASEAFDTTFIAWATSTAP